MPRFVAPASSFKRVVADWVSPDGAWKRVTRRWVEVGGAWKLAFEAGNVKLEPATIRSFCYAPELPESRIDFTPLGQMLATYTDQTVVHTEEVLDWYDPNTAGAGALFEIRAKRIAGTAVVTGNALDQWFALSQQRGWSVVGESIGNNRTMAATLEVEIRSLGGSEILTAAQYTLSTTTFSTSNPNGAFGRGGGIDIIAPDRFNP